MVSMSGRDRLELPDSHQLVAELTAFSAEVEPIARYLEAVKTGRFRHPDGREENLGSEMVKPWKAGLLSHLCRRIPTPLSIEIGFGMGTSALVMLATRMHLGKPFEHVVFDPFGLPDGRGQVVEAYLETQFGKAFRRVRRPSEIGLAELIGERGSGVAGLIFIDGGHRFENVMVDFVLADIACCEGGYIVFDDAQFPAIETVLNYIAANRPDYAIAPFAVRGNTVLKKLGPDQRSWDKFTPFKVPFRHDWEALPRRSLKAVAASFMRNRLKRRSA